MREDVVVIKRFTGVMILVLLGMVLWTVPAMADAPNVDEAYTDLGDNLIKEDGTTYLPLKDIMECLGVSVVWCADDQDKILVAADGQRYQITLSFDYASGVTYANTADGNVTYLVQMKDGRAYFPLEFYQEIVDRDVYYVSNMGRINFIDKSPQWQQVVAATLDQEAVYNNVHPKIKNLAPYTVEMVSRSEAPVAARAEIATVNGIPVDTEQMIWPTTATRISSPYGKRGRGFHSGVDIDGDTGDPVYAAWTGKVIKAGWSGGYGNCIDIEHADGSVTRYAHLNSIDTTVGAIVARGEWIATLGSTGRATGDHLHFEVRKGKATYNPLDYISTSRRV